jgi:ParB family chromosome partitioning protein
MNQTTMKSKPAPRGLGKGLSALMSDSYSQAMTAEMPAARTAPALSGTANGASLTLLDTGRLHGGPYQPRRQFTDEFLHELADSIEKNGIMQPILVRSSTVEAGKYEIIAGERRWRAAKLAQLAQVPVLIREMGDQQALELALVENIQRQDLNPLEEANGYQRLMDEFDYTQEQLASTVGKSRSHIANLLRLLGLPEAIKQHIDKGLLTAGHARALLGAEDAEGIAARVVTEGLSVRQTEQLVKGRQPNEAPLPTAPAPSVPMAPLAVEPPAVPAPHHASHVPPYVPSYAAPQAPAPVAAAPRTAPAPASPYLPKSEDALALEEMLSASLGLRVRIDSVNSQSGQVVVGYETLTQLDEILRRLGGSA